MASLFIIIGAIFMSLKTGESLICFSCSSDNRDKCEALQTATICKSSELACLTLSYDSYIHNKDIGLAQVTVGSVFKKKCVSGNVDCQMYCRYLAGIGKYNCLSRCCDTDFCNHEERLVMVSSSDAIPYNKASKHSSFSCMLFFCSILTTFLLY